MKFPRPLLVVSLSFVVGASLSNLFAVDGTWNTTSSANYSATGNWAGGVVATGTGAVMTYNAAGNGQTITIDTAVSLGSIQFNSSSTSATTRTVTLAIGAGSLTFDTGSSSPALIEMLSSGGTGAREFNLGAFNVVGTGGIEIRNSATQGQQRVRFNSTTSLNGGDLTLTNSQSTSLDFRAESTNPFGTSSVPDVVFAGTGVTSITASSSADITIGTVSSSNVNASMNATDGHTITFGGADDGTFAGRLTGPGAFVKAGAGVQTLTGTNTNTGGTIEVAAGTLLMNGQGVSSISVTTGTLGGTGDTGGDVTIGNAGTLAPGASAGTLEVNTLTLAGTNATLAMELGGTGVGQYDQVSVTGDVNLSGNGVLELSLLSFTPMADDLFFLILNDGTDAINGTLLGLAQDSTFSASGYSWQISYTGDFGSNLFSGAGNDLVIMAVPEPSTALLYGLGLALLLGARKLRKNRLA